MFRPEKILIVEEDLRSYKSALNFSKFRNISSIIEFLINEQTRNLKKQVEYSQQNR